MIKTINYMNKIIFENLLIAVFYIRYNEKDKRLKSDKFPTFFKKIEKEVCKLDETLLVEDREKSCQLVKDKLLSYLTTNGEISDTDFYSLLHADANWDTEIDLLSKIIKSDGIISKREKEVILKLANRYGISLEQTKGKLKNKYTKKQKISILGASVIALLIIVFAVGALVVNKIEKKKMEGFNIEKYVEQNPKLIFKTIHFYKLVVHGKPDGTNKNLDKLNILHLTGNADLYIDMNYLKIDSDNTDFIQKKISLIYNSPSRYPVSIDINIPSGNYTLVEEIEPVPINEAEAETIAKPVSIIAGGIAGLIGGNIGSKFAKHPVAKLFSGAVGAGFAGIGAGAASYVYTKDFLMELELTKNELKDKENVLEASKGLIALEIMGGDILSEPDYDSKLQKYYQAECERQLIEIMKAFGWKTVEIKFYNKQ